MGPALPGNQAEEKSWLAAQRLVGEEQHSPRHHKCLWLSHGHRAFGHPTLASPGHGGTPWDQSLEEGEGSHATHGLLDNLSCMNCCSFGRKGFLHAGLPLLVLSIYPTLSNTDLFRHLVVLLRCYPQRLCWFWSQGKCKVVRTKISHDTAEMLHTGCSPVATNLLCGASACQYFQRLL